MPLTTQLSMRNTLECPGVLAFLGAGPERDRGHGTGGRRRRTLSEGNCGQARGLWGFGHGGRLAFEGAVAVTGHGCAGEAGRGGAFHGASDRRHVENCFCMTFETSGMADGG
jgi:hypothetical protein